MTRYLVLPFALAVAAQPAVAAPVADLTAIEQAASQFAGAPVQPVDPRLRLAPCALPLALGWYGGDARVVLAQCPAPGGWRLYLPLAGGAGAPQRAAAPLVARGDQVSIMLTGDGFTLSQTGEALEDGAAGSWIKVRPAAAAKAEPLRARVIRPGLVGIDLP